MSFLKSTLFRLVLVLLSVFFNLFSSVVNCQKISHTSFSESSCPLNYNVLHDLAKESPPKIALVDVPTQCKYLQKGILFVRSEYLRTHGYFVPPPETAEVCWELYGKVVAEFFPDFVIQTICGYHPEWILSTFGNVTKQKQFESLIPVYELQEIRLFCNQSLGDVSVCQYCIAKLLSLEKLYFQNLEADNVSVSADYLFMYAAAFSNEHGSSDPATAECLFRLKFSSRFVSKSKHKAVMFGVVLGSITGVFGASVSIWLFWMVHKKIQKKKITYICKDENSLDLGLGLHRGSSNLVKFRIDEISRATMNFSRNLIIGKGGYGNVYKGILRDGSEVAFKRFKNRSASGGETFAHEVEIIASVRHVNLVALRGYCTANAPLEGRQRIIVCDLMRNGSLYDHLFGTGMEKLSWAIRQKIALGTARGLAYLHHGVHPAIIHRDIKASNILLDETFEAKVADFGLAKFNSQGTTHLSTKVAGTLGYVAPEYALYGKLTEKSDVYSYGVVLLELLSGRKAYEIDIGEVSLLTDWAWKLVQEGRAVDVIEKDMPEMESLEVMEQYVHIAVICAHTQLHARPTMYQIVKILEKNLHLVPWRIEAYISSGYTSDSSITSNQQNSDGRDGDSQGSLTVTIV